MAFLVLPMPGSSAPLSSRIDQKKQQIQHHKAKEGVLSTTIQGYSSRIDAVQGQISATAAAAEPGPEQPRPAEGEAARGPQPARGGARQARAAAQPARHGAHRAGAAAGRDLQGGCARRAHRDPRVRRLRRPARARRVPEADLGPGPRDHRPGARPARQGAGPGRRSSPTSRSRSRWWPSGSCASATRWPPSRTSSWARATSSAVGARRQARRARPGARQPRGARGRPRALEKEQARVQAALQGAGADLRRARSGRAAAR